jgi:ribosomal protein L29
MKKNEWQQFKTKPEAELQKTLVDSRDRLWKLRNDLAGGKVKNVKEIKSVKELIARVLTLINNQNHDK